MAFLRVAFAVLVLTALPVAAQHAQGQSSSSKPRAHFGASPAPGKVRDGVYRNPTFGFTYKLPFDWVERTDQMRQDSAAPQSLLLLSAFERPPEAAGDTVNSAVLIAAESVSSYPGLKTAEDYFGPLTEVATSQGFQLAKQPYKVELGAKRMIRSDFSKELGKLTMHQASLVTRERGYLLSFTFIGSSEDEVEQLIRGLQFPSLPKVHATKPAH
ncbi:MAG: hypothetical protein DMG70_20335 [Acidobacteria bacterium]|nr:MAG: hypothetical protein DMG70_20335 [Acidobacteriota bacterium]PYY08453.1 MAG: hypothetical protein DMG69_14560 [Acidobacteriota bacterium]